MGVTLYVDGWHKQPSREVKVYMDERYPDLDSEHFECDPYCKKDADGRYYQMEVIYDNPFPEISISSESWTVVAGLAGLAGVSARSEGQLQHEEIPGVIRHCMAALNSEKRCDSAAIPAQIHGNFMSFGVPADRITRHLSSLLDLLKFAQNNNSLVYWG